VFRSSAATRMIGAQNDRVSSHAPTIAKLYYPDNDHEEVFRMISQAALASGPEPLGDPGEILVIAP